MKILLDTHILLWLLSDDEMLSDLAKDLVSDEENEIFFSPLSIVEIEIKRLAHPDKMFVTGEQVGEFCKQSGFNLLPLELSHAMELKNLKRSEDAPPHKDTFDKLMLCQAIAEDMLFMTHDKLIAGYDAPSVYKV